MKSTIWFIVIYKSQVRNTLIDFSYIFSLKFFCLFKDLYMPLMFSALRVT